MVANQMIGYQYYTDNISMILVVRDCMYHKCGQRRVIVNAMTSIEHWAVPALWKECQWTRRDLVQARECL